MPAVMATCALLTVSAAQAAPGHDARTPTPARQAELATVQRCLQQASHTHAVPMPLLRAIAQQESGLRPQALNHNADGSSDLGLMQINTRWLPTLARHGIARRHLFDPCTNAHVGAWIMAAALRRHGDTWQAVGSYHSATPTLTQRYAWVTYRHMLEASLEPDAGWQWRGKGARGRPASRD